MSEIRSQATPAKDSGLTDALRDAVGDNYELRGRHHRPLHSGGGGMSEWADMGAGVHCAPTGVLYVNGKELGTVDEIQFASDETEDFGGKTIDTRISRTFTVSVDYIEVPPVVTRPPKRPPDPERPMWVRDPAKTRRTAYGPTRRVK